MDKYVIVSGRSSHTVSANSKDEARRKFEKQFPYAQTKFIAKVPKDNSELKKVREQ